MKKFILFSSLLFALVGCKKENQEEQKILQTPIAFEFIRFDQDFAKTQAADLPKLKAKYPYLFAPGISDSVWLNKKNDSLFKEVQKEVNIQFTDTKKLEQQLKSLFQHITYYFPDQKPGKVIGLLSDMDVLNRVIYADTLTLIGLDTYLGKNHRFYEGFDSYTLKEFEADKIPSDIAESFLSQKVVPTQERSFLSHLIYAGKILYGKDRLLPSTSDALKIGYTEDQIKWCEANEAQMWKYFIENKLLYDTDPKLYNRFIQNAPFSKFYLELDSESPGKVGAWIGWQIVRAYMQNNDVTLQELFIKDPKEIFEKSNYKPKK